MMRDAEDPRRRLGAAAEACRTAPHLDHRIRHDLCSRVVVANEASDEAEDATFVCPEKRLERIAVACRHTFDERAIALGVIVVGLHRARSVARKAEKVHVRPSHVPEN